MVDDRGNMRFSLRLGSKFHSFLVFIGPEESYIGVRARVRSRVRPPLPHGLTLLWEAAPMRCQSLVHGLLVFSHVPLRSSLFPYQTHVRQVLFLGALSGCQALSNFKSRTRVHITPPDAYLPTLIGLRCTSLDDSSSTSCLAMAY